LSTNSIEHPTSNTAREVRCQMSKMVVRLFADICFENQATAAGNSGTLMPCCGHQGNHAVVSSVSPSGRPCSPRRLSTACSAGYLTLTYALTLESSNIARLPTALKSSHPIQAVSSPVPRAWLFTRNAKPLTTRDGVRGVRGLGRGNISTIVEISEWC
jgi:hypothetical protein